MAMIIVWATALVLFIIAEVATDALVSVWFIGGSVAGLIAAICGAEIWLQIVLFVVVSAALLLLLRPLLKKFVDPKKTATNVDSLLGKEAVVTEQIDNLLGQGCVKVSGTPWSARSTAGDIIPEGSVVTVKEVRGVCLYVEATEQNKKEESL